jgi:hypothetical protein
MRVARGRTIQDSDRTWSDGDEITLPVEEAKRLHALGFLLAEGEADTRPPTDFWVTQPKTPGLASVTVLEPAAPAPPGRLQ